MAGLSNTSRQRILVTGADGFIGSHLCETLLAKGHEVTAFCMYNSFGKKGWLDTLDSQKLEKLNIVFGDIRDPDSVDSVVKGNEYILHLAALIAIPYSYIAPASYIETNINGTLNILQAARKYKVKKVIHTSTSETYGTAKFVPITENHPLVAQSPYAASKIGADQLAISFFRSFGLPVSILRPFNTFGPRQSCRAVIPSIIMQISSGSRKISLGSLTPTRDFNYVQDTCNAFEALCFSKDTEGMICNSASEYEISIGDTANMISEIMNTNVEIISEDLRIRPESSEVFRLFGDSKLLQEKTGWKPIYSGIDGFREGLRKTIEWFVLNENIKHYSDANYLL